MKRCENAKTIKLLLPIYKMVVDIPLTLIKTAAVSGIVLVWANFTVKAFKMSWHIISTSPEKEEIWPKKKMVVCEECQKHFFDDGNEWEQQKLLCETCRVLY